MIPITASLGRLRRGLLALSLAATGLAGWSSPAQAEGRIRIAEQFGIVYLLLHVSDELNWWKNTAKPWGWM